MKTKHIICFSGGEGSAITAIEVARIFGKENIILLNHDINPKYEDNDIKRFKEEIANYIGVQITYANVDDIDNTNKIPSQFDVCIKKKTFVNPANRQILCTYVLKTEPFYNYLKKIEKDNICVYYGFDDKELNRVERRESILKIDGIETDYPLALWSFDLIKKYNEYKKNQLLKTYNKLNKTKLKTIPEDYLNKAIELGLIEISEYNGKERSLQSIKDIGIDPPNTYKKWKHANCKGCLKAGQQHWYCVYVNENEIFQEAKQAEEIIGYSFGNFGFLKDLETKFESMKKKGIPANENIPSNIFWKSVKNILKQTTEDIFPCECFSY